MILFAMQVLFWERSLFNIFRVYVVIYCTCPSANGLVGRVHLRRFSLLIWIYFCMEIAAPIVLMGFNLNV